jgi:drug/metabolite transporter (DMT)-like permease
VRRGIDEPAASGADVSRQDADGARGKDGRSEDRSILGTSAVIAEPTRDARRAALADASLLLVAILWGFNFVVIKDAIGRVDPMLYVMLRYWVAFVLLAAIMPGSVIRSTRRDWFYGGILGVFYLSALVIQTYGLQWTTPGKSGFITGLSVAMVPFIYWLIARRSPGRFQILGALIAAVGLGVLSLRGNLTLSLGDGLTLIGALFYAMHITATGFFAPQVRPATLAVTQIGVSAVLCTLFTPFVTHISLGLGWRVWVAIVWTAFSGTVLAFVIQSWAQRHTTSTHAAVLLCLESVFSALFGVIFGMDSVTWRLLAGAGLILTGILVLETLPLRRAAETEAPTA